MKAAAPPPAPPPRRASACHLLSPARPLGVYSCRGGCRAALGVGRGPVGRQWVSAAGGGGRGGEPPRPGLRPRLLHAGLWRGRPVCAVLGAAGPPGRPVACGRFTGGACRGRGPSSARVQRPLRGGCGAAVSSVCLRPLLGLRGRGGELGGPSGPLARPSDGRGGAAWQSRPRGPAVGWGVALFPRPPLPRAGPSGRPSLGFLVPPAVAARRWPAGGGREG